ncbi:MAG: hypothetical protein K6F04_02650 [bacterium]|nr:hypothetical protein [bacterium]
MNTLNTFEDKRNAKEFIVGHHYSNRDGRIISIKESKYDLYKKQKRIYESLKYENKSRDIDEYLRRCVAIQLLVNKCRED